MNKLRNGYLTKAPKLKYFKIIHIKVFHFIFENNPFKQTVKSGQKEKAKLFLLQKRQVEEELKAFSTGKTEYM